MKQIISALLVLGFAAAANASAGSFKLYSQLNAQPSPDCDVFTALELAPVQAGGGAGMSATLSERVGGYCEIAVFENKRTHHDLQVVDAGCGSLAYVSPQIKITDHRNRTCRDLQPALIVVEEALLQGTSTLYSKDR